MDRRTASIVATILVSGSWTPSAALQRFKDALGKAGSRKRWPGRIVDAVFASRQDSVRPGVAEIRAFLMTEVGLAHSAVETLQTWSRNID